MECSQRRWGCGVRKEESSAGRDSENERSSWSLPSSKYHLNRNSENPYNNNKVQTTTWLIQILLYSWVPSVLSSLNDDNFSFVGQFSDDLKVFFWKFRWYAQISKFRMGHNFPCSEKDHGLAWHFGQLLILTHHPKGLSLSFQKNNVIRPTEL